MEISKENEVVDKKEILRPNVDFVIFAKFSSIIGSFLALALIFIAIWLGMQEPQGWVLVDDTLSNLGNPTKYNRPVSLLAVAYALGGLSNIPLFISIIVGLKPTEMRSAKIGSWFLLFSGISVFCLAIFSENFNDKIEFVSSEPHLLVSATFFANFGFAMLFFFFGFIRYPKYRMMGLWCFISLLIVGGIWSIDEQDWVFWHHDGFPELVTITFYLITLMSLIKLIDSSKKKNKI